MADCSANFSGRSQSDSEPGLKPGSRFQLTRLGIERLPKTRVRTGTVLNVARNANGFRVQFDGAKTAQSLHRSYIMAMDFDEPC